MTLSMRMRDLQIAMERYGEMTVKHYRFIHAFGDDVVQRLPAYLGEGARVLGVPPAGEYRSDAGDYSDAKFSTHSIGLLNLSPIQMGVAIGIPHAKDGGMSWLRVVLEFEMSGDTMKVTVGDGEATVRGVPIPHDAEDVERVCDAFYEYVRSMLEDPVRAATAIGHGKLGFI